MLKDYSIRLAALDDIPHLVRLRRLMFEWMNYSDQEVLDKNDSYNEEYFSKSIPNESFIGWLVCTTDGKSIASGGLVIDQHPPGPSNPSGKIGYIMDISVEPDFRHQGIAKKILKEILQYLKDQKITLASLHASEMGKSLYEKTGFKPTNEMRLKFSDINQNYLDLD